MGTRLELPSVTLCSVACVNVDATITALSRSLDLVHFGRCILLTDKRPDTIDPRISVKFIEPIRSARDYSIFVLKELVDHIDTDHVLLCQWDGFVTDPAAWDEDFLRCDYIGAIWPQFADGRVVGNGGFSLRSRRLLQACRDPGFVVEHPEDVAICRTNRTMLEERHSCRFAEPALAASFSFERQRSARSTFGFHGVFNMVPLLGAGAFWQMYSTLDDRRTVWTDYWLILAQLAGSVSGWLRMARMSLDRLKNPSHPRVRGPIRPA